MDKYIDREELYNVEKLLDTDIVRRSKTASWLMDQLLHDIKAIPAADVAPVVHGRWVNVLLHREKPIRMDALCALCSNCKKESDRTAFCPHCGAKMDKDGTQK